MHAERATAAWTATGTFFASAMVTLVDPNQPGHYPRCPTKLLTGLDCPACGTLRGLHDLSRGHVAAALDHNLLLLVAVPLGLWIWLRWARTAITGDPPHRVRWPAWVAPTAILVATAFTIARNLPLDGSGWLAST